MRTCSKRTYGWAVYYSILCGCWSNFLSCECSQGEGTVVILKLWKAISEEDNDFTLIKQDSGITKTDRSITKIRLQYHYSMTIEWLQQNSIEIRMHVRDVRIHSTIVLVVCWCRSGASHKRIKSAERESDQKKLPSSTINSKYSTNAHNHRINWVLTFNFSGDLFWYSNLPVHNYEYGTLQTHHGITLYCRLSTVGCRL